MAIASDHNLSQGEYLPRPDLRVDAFRKYEPYMASASLAKTLVIQPWEFPQSKTRKMLKAWSFICRFNDAKTAYRRYKYESLLLPANFDVDNLKCHELVDGSVLIENLQFTSQGRPIMSSDHVTLLRLAEQMAAGEQFTSLPFIRMNPVSESDDLAYIHGLEEDPRFYGKFVCAPEPIHGLLRILL